MRELAKVNTDEDEVTLGPLTFEWDAANGGIQVSKSEDEAVAYIEFIATSQWEDFVYACVHQARPLEEDV